MSANALLDNFDKSAEASVAHMRKEFSKLQVGRANPELFEDVLVEVYGSKQPVKNVAQIIVQDAKSILIKPFDRSVIGDIEQGILKAQLGFNPNNNGESIIINIPPLSEERRRELVKVVSKFTEEAKISIRQARQKVQQGLKELKSSDEISEDEQNRCEKKLQDKVDSTNKDVEELSKNKEQDILKV